MLRECCFWLFSKKSIISLCLKWTMMIVIMVCYSLREKYSYLKFFWSVFSRICSEYGDSLPYSVWMIKNTHLKNFKCGQVQTLYLAKFMFSSYSSNFSQRINQSTIFPELIGGWSLQFLRCRYNLVTETNLYVHFGKVRFCLLRLSQICEKSLEMPTDFLVGISFVEVVESFPEADLGLLQHPRWSTLW